METETLELNNSTSRPRLIAFYLPQYHPIAENNIWWGKGFTEWTNVTKATSRFRGHYQPHLPSELGFYDLRLPEVRQAQADLATEFGIYGFCYYHYWFNGKRLLERPFTEVLESGEPDFPFCLCWANENWTRRWDGKNSELLAEQKYHNEDYFKHIEYLENAFKDKRYIRINNRPVFLIYRCDLIPDVNNLIKIWRSYVASKDYDGLYMCAVYTSDNTLSEEEIITAGFDSIVNFQPNAKYTRKLNLTRRHLFSLNSFIGGLLNRLINQFITISNLSRFFKKLNTFFYVDYKSLVDLIISQPKSKFNIFPTVFPSWDNSARRHQGATIIQNSDPQVFERFLDNAIERVIDNDAEEQIVFINAWNEWAEGCHLEPDKKNERNFLKATSKSLKKINK